LHEADDQCPRTPPTATTSAIIDGVPRLSRVYYFTFRTKRGAEAVLAQALAEDPAARLELRRDAREKQWVGQLLTQGPLSSFYGPLQPTPRPGSWGRRVRVHRATHRRLQGR